MYFPQDNPKNGIDEGEKLKDPSKGHFKKLRIFLAMIFITISIIIAQKLCQFFNWASPNEKGSLGSFLTITCFLIYDLFMIRTIFYKGQKQRIYRFKLRSAFASTSTLIAILLTYMCWAGGNTFGTLALIPILCLCLNFILNFILDRLQPAKAQAEETSSMIQVPSVLLRPRPQVEIEQTDPHPEIPPMRDPRRRYPSAEEAYPMMQTPPELWQ